MGPMHWGSGEEFYGDQRFTGVVVWCKKSLGTMPFILFLLKIVPTEDSSLAAIISGRKNRKWLAFVEGHHMNIIISFYMSLRTDKGQPL